MRVAPRHIALLVLLALLVLGGSSQALPGTETVDGGDIVDNSITGKDIKESSLGAVPRAQSVGGARLVRFSKATALIDQPVEIKTIPGVAVVALVCAQTGPNLRLRSLADDSVVLGQVNDGAAGTVDLQHDPDLDLGEFVYVGDGDSTITVTADLMTPSNRVVHVEAVLTTSGGCRAGGTISWT